MSCCWDSSQRTNATLALFHYRLSSPTRYNVGAVRQWSFLGLARWILRSRNRCHCRLARSCFACASCDQVGQEIAELGASPSLHLLSQLSEALDSKKSGTVIFHDGESRKSARHENTSGRSDRRRGCLLFSQSIQFGS